MNDHNFSRATALYRLKDATGEIIYIGISSNWPTRLTAHATSQQWWSEVRSVDIERYPTWEAARDAERFAIATEQPLFNQRAGGGGKPPKDQTSLAGYWFLGDRAHSWQGRIVRELDGNRLLLEVFDWFGRFHSHRVIHSEQVGDWMLFVSEKEMIQKYEDLGGWRGWCQYLGVETL